MAQQWCMEYPGFTVALAVLFVVVGRELVLNLFHTLKFISWRISKIVEHHYDVRKRPVRGHKNE